MTFSSVGNTYYAFINIELIIRTASWRIAFTVERCSPSRISRHPINSTDSRMMDRPTNALKGGTANDLQTGERREMRYDKHTELTFQPWEENVQQTSEKLAILS